MLAAKTKSLRSYVRSTSGNRRLFPMDPDSNNYINIERTVLRGKTEVLLPLLALLQSLALALAVFAEAGIMLVIALPAAAALGVIRRGLGSLG